MGYGCPPPLSDLTYTPLLAQTCIKKEEGQLCDYVVESDELLVWTFDLHLWHPFEDPLEFTYEHSHMRIISEVAYYSRAAKISI